ncbi:MAG: thermonuclease family protein [Gammaproteobacteria bacterium]|nr:thermonuclease family protein [Gammaproteobacteria bacterium]
MYRSLLAVPLLISSLNATAADQVYRLLQVEDGDTLLVEIAGQPVRVQLAEIDAPEDVANPKLAKDSQRTGNSTDELLRLGRASTDHLKRMLPVGSGVHLQGELKRKDKYGRVPAFVRSLSGAPLNARMVRDGYAVVLHGYPPDTSPKEVLLEAEAAAIAENAGLWGSDSQLMQAWSGRNAPN